MIPSSGINGTSQQRAHSLLLRFGADIIVVLALSVFFYGNPIHFPDSDTYIADSIIRSPLYTWFLKAWQLVDAPLGFVHVPQLFFGGLGICYLLHTLRHFFGLHPIRDLLTAALLLIPYVVMNHFGNAVLSEALAYPIFLLCVSFFIRTVKTCTFRNALILGIFTSLLILTRKQFVFMWPFLGINLGILIYAVGFKRAKPYVFLLAGFCLLTSGVEYTRNYIKGGYFQGIPFTGMQLIVLPVYVASQESMRETEATFQISGLETIWTEVHQQKLSSADAPSTLLRKGRHYCEAFNPICHQIVNCNPDLCAVQKDMDIFQADRLRTRLAMTLIQKNFSSYVQMYLINIIYGFRHWTLFLGAMCLGLFAAAYAYRHRSVNALLTWNTILLSIANVAAVALVEPAMRRYTFYTVLIQMLPVIVFAFHGLSWALTIRKTQKLSLPDLYRLVLNRVYKRDLQHQVPLSDPLQ